MMPTPATGQHRDIESGYWEGGNARNGDQSRQKEEQAVGKCVWTGAIINKGEKDNEFGFDKLENVSTLMAMRRKKEPMLKAGRGCLM